MIETEIKPHDIVPPIPIIAGDRRVHEAAMAMLKGSDARSTA